MKAIKVFLLGVLYGWLIKWMIDKIYKEDPATNFADENILLKQRIQSLETALQSKSLESQSALQIIPQARKQSRPVQIIRDDLKVIEGIGPATEKRLNNAGIHTFAELARLKPDELQNILGNSKRLAHGAGSFISQAKRLAQ